MAINPYIRFLFNLIKLKVEGERKEIEFWKIWQRKWEWEWRSCWCVENWRRGDCLVGRAFRRQTI